MAQLLAERGQDEDALQLMRTHADNGDRRAGEWLIDLLAAQGQAEELER
ncbi:hypothetical protein QRX60_17725 [Amycolatopsis mongoliensis]|uniref:Sel1 repeat family protein n=1 Tax=Amycolatopsis mongoliensis TaxID=715475 RepID=A0A9Y2NH95_9PSEU|nr:hypothetical protein [Amycolatopsis sp. 4-36]WIY05596.1 hypothetical protein QRX60_17725 [Amycolatopsis sp. 4-36]